MLRTLRIVGIVVFALMLGYAANTLYKMYAAGSLLEQYNSDRKAGITLMVLSVFALGALGAFEFRGLKNRQQYRYGQRRYMDGEPGKRAVEVPSNIYSAPQSVDEWQGHRVSRGKPRHRQKPLPEMHEVWLKVLRILSMVLPLLYFVGFLVLYSKGMAPNGYGWLYPAIGASYVLIAVIAAFGILRRKPWGLSVGYVLAILNLVFFPVGTAIGLLLLVSLVGASSALVQPSSRSRKRTHSFV